MPQSNEVATAHYLSKTDIRILEDYLAKAIDEIRGLAQLKGTWALSEDGKWIVKIGD